MERTFLVLGAVFGLIGVMLGAFGSHALRSKLSPERVATFETGIRYQMWHALALFAVVFVGSVRFVTSGGESAVLTPFEGTLFGWPAALAGWLLVAGIILFPGSLYMVALTGRRGWGVVTPIGGICLVLGWFALAFEASVG